MVLSDDFYYQPIRIDTINTRVFADLIAKEGDANGRGLLVTLTENGLMKDTIGIALNLKWEHTSVGNQGLDNFEAVDLSKGLYKITYPTEMLNRGKVRAFIQIIDSGKLAGTRNIEITVDRGVGDDTAIASSDSFTALAQALIDVSNLGSTYAQDIVSVKQQLEQAATETEVEVERQRINAFVALAEGSTTGDAELMDARIGANGVVHPVAGANVRAVDTRTEGIANQDDTAFYITDQVGNIIFKADETGVTGVGLSGGTSAVASPYTGKKLVTIGDSLSAHDLWQKWLVEWLGVTFNLDENLNGADGHAAMAVGGTAVNPTASNSIYIRSLDAKYYSPDIIIVYAGQNDVIGDYDTGVINESLLGTINDTPYVDRIVTTTKSFYAGYMGMVQCLIADNPLAKIFLMTQMPARLEVGMVGTEAPWTGIVRYPTEVQAQVTESVRYKKVEAIRAIGAKYNVPVIDLWKDAGINHYNAASMYSAPSGTCAQVHNNDAGYKRIAEVANKDIN